MTRRLFALTLSCLPLAMLFAAEEAKPKRAMTPEDSYSVASAGDPRISPDGKWVAYTVAKSDKQLNGRNSEVWVGTLDGSIEPRQITTAESSREPRWSPDGRTVAFVSARRDSAGTLERPQVYGLPMQGGEARRLTSLKDGVTAFSWSPDGRTLACISRTAGREAAAGADKARSDLRHYTNPNYKLDGSGFFDSRRAHLWLVEIASGKATQLTFHAERNDADPQWSPDGSKIVFVGQRTDLPPMQGGELLVIPAAGGEALKISDRDTGIRSPRWSHDGKQVAYIAAENEIAIPKLWLYAAAGGATKLLSNDVTYPTEIEWARDGKGLLFTAPWHGEHPLFHIDLASRKTTAMTKQAFVRQLETGENGAVAYASGSEVLPGEIFVLDRGATQPRQVSNAGAKLLSEVRLQPAHKVLFKGAGGMDMEGFLLEPAGRQEGRKYPMILYIHGGPNGMCGYNWAEYLQAIAGHGYGVLCMNPRGSSGYGEAHQRAVDKEWGGKAYQDIMLGVDATIARYPWIDADKLGVFGHSYGGFMTDWIVGQTNRFKAAATMAGISNFISDEATRDAHYGHARDFGGDLFENFDLYWKYSPIRNAKNIKTPVLVLHGDADQRVPLEQGEQFFRALQHFKVPSEFVILPGESHSLRGQPRHAVDLMEWKLYWFDRWVKGIADARRPGAN